MSHLVDFYSGDAHSPDSEGRTLQDILAWPDDDLEAVHDFIQWLFPLPEPGQFNPDAPLLTPSDIAAFRSDPTLRANLRKSFGRIVAFLGLTMTGIEVTEGPNFAERAPDVWAAPNHNWLRVTRILRSLTLLGLDTEAGALFNWLDSAYRSRRFPITAETFTFWAGAVRGAGN